MRSIIETSAKAIIIRDGKMLLIQNRDVAGLGTWHSLPGGRQRFGETLEQALIREVQEETGYLTKAGKVRFIREYIHEKHELRTYGPASHKIEIMFECTILGIEGAEMTKKDAEQMGVEWVELTELSALTILPAKLKNIAALLESEEDVYWGDILF